MMFLNSSIVDLSQKEIDEIKKGPNDYTETFAPVSSKNRTWGVWDVSSLWIGMIVSIAVYQVASGLLVSGMTWYQALFTIVLGHTLVMGVAIIIGHFGVKYGLGYPFLSKIVFGNKGKLIPSIIRGILGVFWFGVQTWIGGEALNIIIQTFIPSFSNMGFNASIISFILFWFLNIYIATSGNKGVKILETFSAPILIIMSLIVIIWGLSTADWSITKLLSAKVLQANNDTPFIKLFFPALSSMIAFDGGIALSMADYTRECKNQKAQVYGQLISAPLITGYVSFVGICGTAGAYLAFGKEIWEPAVLVGNFSNPIVRILFSIFIIMAVLTTNVAGNLMPAVNIVASYAKDKFSFKTITIFTAFLALLSQPWNSMSSAYHLIYEVTQFLGALLGPLSGIYIAWYLFDVKTNVNLVDAYKIDEGIYNYNKGWNTEVIAIVLILTGIVVGSKYIESLKFIFNNAYVFGVFISMILYKIYIKIKK